MNKSKKFDASKPRWDLLPLRALAPVVDVLSFGAAKYGDNNWQNLLEFKPRYTAAFLRHFVAWQSGEKLDPESGHAHLAHAVTNLIFLLWQEQQQNESQLSIGTATPNKNSGQRREDFNLLPTSKEFHEPRDPHC